MPNLTTITVGKGESKAIDLTIKKNDTALDITGGTVYFYVKDEIDDNTVLLTKNATLTAPASGQAQVVLNGGNDGDTDINTDHYYYEVWYEDSGGNKYHIGIGDFIVEDTLNIPS